MLVLEQNLKQHINTPDLEQTRQKQVLFLLAIVFAEGMNVGGGSQNSGSGSGQSS